MSPHPSSESSKQSSGSSCSSRPGSRPLPLYHEILEFYWNLGFTWTGRDTRAKANSLSQKPLQELVDSLLTHQVNTLTELCRIERIAAACVRAEDAQAFQEPMTTSWNYYVNSNQFLTELQGLTRSYPFNGDIVRDAHVQVCSDPDSNRSWNLAWLVLTKIKEENLIPGYAVLEANKPEMWGGRIPSPEEAQQLRMLFEDHWTRAVDRMLRHWTSPPTWY
ncbi:hypothetical protein ACRALDRAFT_1069913 [Sodiomyces alcalophilus JCM 7366]|uniref:uncharacterized protein n=1 Tax=Sodiomyces alcalophilus JCM 7366 TaxID=591952 RepID=UPI0039B485F9